MLFQSGFLVLILNRIFKFVGFHQFQKLLPRFRVFNRPVNGHLYFYRFHRFFFCFFHTVLAFGQLGEGGNGAGRPPLTGQIAG